jgi:hypothetical protein
VEESCEARADAIANLWQREMLHCRLSNGKSGPLPNATRESTSLRDVSSNPINTLTRDRVEKHSTLEASKISYDLEVSRAKESL